MTPPARREELERWIAESQRLQRTLKIVLGTCFVIALGLGFWNRTLGGVALAIVALVAICGFWVTASHIADWRTRSAALDMPPPPPTGSRRWQG